MVKPKLFPRLILALGALAFASTGIADELQTLAASYDIAILDSPVLEAKAKNNTFQFTAPIDNDAIDAYAKVLARELRRYPPESIKRSGLKRIVFCDSLTHQGTQHGGLTDHASKSIYLNIHRRSYAARSRSVQAGSLNRVRRSIHHELFHLIHSRIDDDGTDDAKWSALNPTGFKYAMVTRFTNNKKFSSEYADETPGFLTTYSTVSFGED